MYLTRLGEIILFSPRLENYQFSYPRRIFLIYGNTLYVFSTSHSSLIKIHESTYSTVESQYNIIVCINHAS